MVLILDTLEVPLHLVGISLASLLKSLADVQREAPCVRVVLAGRYRIEDTVSTLNDLFTGSCEPFELPRFSDAEAREYLTSIRHVAREDHVAAAITASSCVPFSLALLADLITENPDISARAISSYRGADYAYLVERVVKRIPEDLVRWVVRYAALPRRFDYEFVRDVVWPRVLEERSGNSRRDDPARDQLGQIDRQRSALWKVGELLPTDEAEVRRVWEQVRRYASGSSWITPDEKDPDAVRLQPEVTRPLRELLRGRDIVPVLHEAAAAYFLRKADVLADGAAEGPATLDRRGDLLREAVFHRFQRDGCDAGAWWAERIRATREPQIRFALANELARGPDYTDRDGRPLKWSEDKPLVSETTLQEARLELCVASAQLASVESNRARGGRLGDEHVLWQTAAEALAALESFPTDALPPGRLALAQAAVALGRGSADEAHKLVTQALAAPDLTPRERLWIAVLDLQQLVAAGSDEAAERLTLGTVLAAEAPEERELRLGLAIAGITHHAGRGKFDVALQICADAQAEQLGEMDFRFYEAMLRARTGDVETARAVVREVAEARSELAAQALVVMAGFLRRQYRFTEAARAAQIAYEAVARQPGDSPDTSWTRGWALFENGESMSALLAVEQARGSFGEAVRVFEDAGDKSAASRCHLAEAKLLMRRLGHLRAAGVALDYAMRAASGDRPATVQALLLRAELTSRLGDAQGAAQLIERAEDENARSSDPAISDTVAVAGLAFGARRKRDHYTDMLADSFARVSPKPATLLALRGIERCPVLKPDSKAVAHLREQIPKGGWDGALAGFAARDRAVLRLRAAGLLRVMGENGAERMLAGALDDFGHDEQTPVELREV
ncbi:MAG: hypothetical protein JO372_05100, partial [Solirubrobacterales bacterium]|nr:hypothetical protein [Solirubrobacterales bacterium]